MFYRPLILGLLACFLALCGRVPVLAQDLSNDASASVTTGMEKPYLYERRAYGYDPEGFDYKQNQAEDFQVIFISSVPFTALASFGLVGTVSLALTGNFGTGGDYFIPFLAGAFIGSTTIACVSVLTNPYPAPNPSSYVEKAPALPPMAFKFDLARAEF